MKLIGCHIENFGKLSEVNFQFSDGLNVINEANAWGKSTLAAFLKAMFYGLDSKKTIGAFEKERVMYRPWQGGTFGGEVDFEVDGKKFRISRSFGRTEKNDEFHLYDLRTNLESNEYSENIGNELFELDSASFKRSIYIAQNDCASGSTDSIHAKLGNLVENTDDINNYESASRYIKNKLNQLTPDRVTGSIKKRKSYITQLMQELKTYDAAQEGVNRILEKKQDLLKQMQNLIDNRKKYAEDLVVASEDSRRKELHEQYESLCREVEEKEKKKNEYDRYFPVEVPTEEEFQKQMQNASRANEVLTMMKHQEFTLEEKIEFKKLNEIFTAKDPFDVKLNFKETLSYTIFLFIGVLSVVLALVALTIWKFQFMPLIENRILLNIAIISGVIATVFGLMGMIFALCAQSNLHDLESKAQQYLLLKRKKEDYEKEEHLYKKLRREFDHFTKSYCLEMGGNIVHKLNFLQTKAAEYYVVESSYEEICQKKKEFEKKYEKELWMKRGYCPYSLEELNHRIAQTDKKLEECKEAKVQYDKQLEELQEQLDIKDEKENKLKELQELQEKEVKDYQVLMFAQEYLQLAKEQFTARYMKSIAKGFKKYYGMLTGDKSENWMIDANLELKFREKGEFRETHWLSAGYRDLSGVCMRLALVDAMYCEEKPFLIFDDPFVNLDQDKVVAGNELLLDVAKEYQVIYFTCHESRCP